MAEVGPVTVGCPVCDDGVTCAVTAQLRPRQQGEGFVTADVRIDPVPLIDHLRLAHDLALTAGPPAEFRDGDR